MGRPRTPALSPQRIVAEATALIDEEGLAALTTRRLAARLGIKGPSIYNHFATMDAVADAVINSLLETVDTTIFESVGWRAALPVWAKSYWGVLQRHPGIVPLMARGPGTRSAQLRLADAFYGSLVDGGWPPRQATEVAIAVRNFIAGSALGSYSAGFAEGRDFYAEEFPHLQDAYRLPERQALLDLAAFERGLTCMIDGLVLHYATDIASVSKRGTAPQE
ncbi:TetR/AcrR family transcriptional regulator (plasmid) [Paenarthrobacter sp. OM7]|uniref:TetR/AcrR family transcriptional regulator n=1 Tax=Paenarthrobacter sp. OM7 TaxID=3041264 RepID=UPI00246846AD|nr:TetR/AcrR family transcriptional regulator [Paenarthrobacter sp. OM7]WGM22924.1 TetR/AcrR family transcriptional regulator [Paenarthrobacter sp. OM7]